MSKYFAVYKCPLCGKLSRVAESVEIHYNDLPKVLGQIVKNQQFAGHPILYQAPMHIPCRCEDGNAGLAQFAGLVRDQD